MYSSAADVRQYSQIAPGDLGFESEQDLDTWIEARLVEISDMIDEYCERSWTPEEAPKGIHGIAREMGRNVVSLSVTSRETPVVRVDDWRVRMVEPEILTTAIRRALRLYRKKPLIRMKRLRSAKELAELEEAG